MVGRNGQVVRARVIPANPNSTYQKSVRAFFSAQSARWDTLTNDQRAAWRAAAAGYMSKMRLGTNGPLTGNQFFTRVNTTLAELALDPVDSPPATPSIASPAATGLVITNTGGAAAVKLTCPTNPGTNTIVRACAPVKAGVNRTPELYKIGMQPAPAQGSSDITTLYTVKFGAPAVGTRIFVSVQLHVTGILGQAVVFTGVVPPSA